MGVGVVLEFKLLGGQQRDVGDRDCQEKRQEGRQELIEE